MTVLWIFALEAIVSFSAACLKAQNTLNSVKIIFQLLPIKISDKDGDTKYLF